jgi:hypothetical protein
MKITKRGQTTFAVDLWRVYFPFFLSVFLTRPSSLLFPKVVAEEALNNS